MRVICFHNPEEENGYLSNWYSSEFTLHGITFSSAEQYMMYSKAVCFKDQKVAEEILKTDDAAKIKKLGRLVSNYDEHVWNGVRQIAVYEGLLAKFSQQENLKKQLLDTGDNILAECAFRDRIWGIGIRMHSASAQDPKNWKGSNLLGYTLMMVREKLRAEISPD